MKKEAWKKLKRTKTNGDKNEYKRLEKMTKDKVKTAKNGLEREIIKNAKQNPKRFHSYISKQRNVRTKVGPLKDANGDVIIDPQHQAEQRSTSKRSKKRT